MHGEPAQISLSLVLGADGSLTKNGSSRALSSAGDRQRFLALRRECGAIVIGGETARAEPYERTPVPLIILSRTLKRYDNPNAVIWNEPPLIALSKAVKEYGPRILVEGGPRLFRELLPEIRTIHLTLTENTGDSPGFDWKSEFKNFSILHEVESDGERFLTLIKEL